MGDVNKLINWFKAREGKVTYSMTNRLGPKSYDCSSAVFNALIEAGFLPTGTWPGNTENLYALEGKLLVPISRNQVQRGDIFVAGVKGGSLGAGGHTGVALDNKMIIHCNYAGNGITTTGISNNTTYYPCHWYRLRGIAANSNTNATNNLKKGEIEMKCFYKLTDKGDTIYYYDGQNIRPLNHPDEKHILNEIYKANNGKDMPYFEWNEKKGPWNRRLSEAIKRKPI